MTKPHARLKTVRFEMDFRSGIVYHGGRDFDIFDPSKIGTALGERKLYFWTTDSFDNANFYQDGAIHEGRIFANLAAFADAGDFPGLSAPAIADEIYLSRYIEGQQVPDCYVITGMTDGSHRSPVYAVVPPNFEGEDLPAFNRTRKHVWNDEGWVKRRAVGNVLQVVE